MTWQRSAGYAVLGHLLYIVIHHLHYKFCIGGLHPWSLLYGVNSYSNFMCTEVQRWNIQLGESLKGLLVGALMVGISETRSLLGIQPSSGAASQSADSEASVAAQQ